MSERHRHLPEDEETPDPSEDSGSVSSDISVSYAPGFYMPQPIDVTSALPMLYDAIFKEFIPPETIPHNVRTDKYRAFVHVHHDHRPKILTLGLFNTYFDVVIQALRDHDFIGEYVEKFPGRPYTSKYECEQNLKGLQKAIQALGEAGIDRELDAIFELHRDFDFQRCPRNVRDPIDWDIMSLIHTYRPRMALVERDVNTRRRRRPVYTDMHDTDDTTRTNENKENESPRTHTPAPPPAQPPARTPTHTLPPAPRARMPVPELLTQLKQHL
jgi:hypothetical protein